MFESLEHSFPQAGQGSLRALAGCFGFSGDEVEKKCRVLSGGEKARLVMAKMLYDPPNFLVLDEPTNHLDMATKEMLITALSEYEGTMLFVSHDRHFLAALSNRVLELTPEGIHQYGGGYTEYVARTGHEAPGLAELRRQGCLLFLPKLLARDPRTFDQRLELRPDDRRMHLVRSGERGKAAVGAGDHALAADHVGEAARCRCATSSGCSTSTVDCVITPGISTLSSGILARFHSSHSCSWRGLAASNE